MIKPGELYSADCLYRWQCDGAIAVIEPDTVVMVIHTSPKKTLRYLHYVYFLYSNDGSPPKEGLLPLGVFKKYFTRAGVK